MTEISPKPKAYSYIRMSTDIQRKGDSHRRQLKLSEDFAERMGLELVETLEDIGVSAFKGKNSKEGALASFLAAVDTGKVEQGSYLLVESLDRVSRESVLDAFDLFRGIVKKGITIATLADNQIYTKESLEKNIGQIFTTLGIMVRANDESRVKSERLTAVWQHKKANAGSKKITSMCPAWLSLDKSTNSFKFTKMADTVKEIFENSIQGFGTSAICQMLNSDPKKYPPKDKAKGWHKSYVQKILNNPAAYGEYQPHSYRGKDRVSVGDSIPDYFPAVVTKEVFDLSRARMEQRRIGGARRKGDGFANVFTRIIHCDHCGHTVVFRNKGEGVRGGKYLRCGNAERGMNCTAPAWEYGDFESSFFSFVIEINLDSIFSKDKTDSQKRAAFEKLTLLEAKLKSEQVQYDRLIKTLAIVDEDVLEDVAAELNLKKIEIGSIKSQVNHATSELAEVTKPISGSSLKANLAVYKELTDEIDSDELKEIRHKIYNQISQLVTDIKFCNMDRYHAGDDLGDLDTEFLRIVAKKRYKTEAEQMTYLLTKAGQRTYDKYHRTFIVEFKNGVTKYVQPSKKSVMDFNPSPLKQKH